MSPIYPKFSQARRLERQFDCELAGDGQIECIQRRGCDLDAASPAIDCCHNPVVAKIAVVGQTERNKTSAIEQSQLTQRYVLMTSVAPYVFLKIAKICWFRLEGETVYERILRNGRCGQPYVGTDVEVDPAGLGKEFSEGFMGPPRPITRPSIDRSLAALWIVSHRPGALILVTLACVAARAITSALPSRPHSASWIASRAPYGSRSTVEAKACSEILLSLR